MPPKLRKVKTASGATAVQVVVKEGGRVRVLEHLGSAHSEAELAVLWEVGRKKLHHEGQGELDLGLGLNDDADAGLDLVVAGKVSQVLIDVVRDAYAHLGFGVVDDEAFFQLVLARLVEPTSMSDSVRVIRELGLVPPHRNTFNNALSRCADRDYRDALARACVKHVETTGGLSLLLYDVTTLYFEAEKEDDLRKVGYSKERRIDLSLLGEYWAGIAD